MKNFSQTGKSFCYSTHLQAHTDEVLRRMYDELTADDAYRCPLFDSVIDKIQAFLQGKITRLEAFRAIRWMQIRYWGGWHNSPKVVPLSWYMDRMDNPLPEYVEVKDD